MKFETRQRINATLAEVEAALLDDRYPEFLLKNHGVLLEVQPIEKKDLGNKVERKIRYRPKPVISQIGTKKVPPEWFAFVETSTWDKTAKTLRFKNVPTSQKISNMLINDGVLTLRASGEQTERIMDGDISLKLPFLLKLLAPIGEGVIKGEGLKILDGEVPVLEKFIREVIRAK